MAKAKRLPKRRDVIHRWGMVLPKYCECGGLMVYDFDFGRVWSHCDTCTPVQKVNVNKLKARGLVR